jgi:hypothetical protein
MIDALSSTAESRELVTSRRRRLEGQRIVLLRPHRAASADADLAREDAIDAACEPRMRRRSSLGIEERGVFRRVKEPEHVHDRVVVEGRGVVIAALQREDLRPAAVRHLRGEQVVDATAERAAPALVVQSRVRGGEEPELCDRRVVVERRDVLPPIGLGEVALAGPARPLRVVHVLRPAAARRLEGEHRGDERAQRVVVELRCRPVGIRDGERAARVGRGHHAVAADARQLPGHRVLVEPAESVGSLEVCAPLALRLRRKGSDPTRVQEARGVVLDARG